MSKTTIQIPTEVPTNTRFFLQQLLDRIIRLEQENKTLASRIKVLEP